MQLDKVVLKKSLADFDQAIVDEYFRRITRIDVSDVDPRYADKVTRTKQHLMEHSVATVAVRTDSIDQRGDDYLQLDDDGVFRGKMPVRIMKDAQTMFTVAISISDADERKKPNWKTSEEYFYDSWGSAFVAGIDAWVDGLLNDKIDQGMALTPAWEPGHYQFDIYNQETIFHLLDPQEFGCELKSSMLIVPEKTKTCIIGVVPEGGEELPSPCSFCRFGKSCPMSRLLTSEDFSSGSDNRRVRARRCAAVDSGTPSDAGQR